MDLIINRTSKAFYRLPPEMCAVLLEAFPEAFSRIEPKPLPAPAPVRWSVGKGFRGESFLRIVCDSCKCNRIYVGTVADLPTFEKTLCAHTGPVPEDVRLDYESRYTGDLVPVMGKPTVTDLHNKG